LHHAFSAEAVVVEVISAEAGVAAVSTAAEVLPAAVTACQAEVASLMEVVHQTTTE
jgi:hypothetical protein